MKQILDPNPGLRSDAEWRQALGCLVESLSAFTGIEFEPTSWVVHADQPGYACSSNVVNVRGAVSTALRLEACGTVCVTVNFGEAAWASCDLLLFVEGRRARGPTGADLIHFSYGAAGWIDKGWMADDNGEWETHITDEWWKD